MSGIRVVIPLLLCLPLAACPGLGLDDSVTYTDPATGAVVTTTVGNELADQIESAGTVATGVAGKAIGVATGNPVVGISAAALLAALLRAGTTRLRRQPRVEAE